MGYQETNWQNLQAVIDYTIQNPGKKLPIDYKEAGRFILLGKGHRQEDVAQFEQALSYYAGQITVNLEKTSRDKVTNLTFFIEGKKYVPDNGNFVEDSPQNGGRAELEGAIQDALLSTPHRETESRFTWL